MRATSNSIINSFSSKNYRVADTFSTSFAKLLLIYYSVYYIFIGFFTVRGYDDCLLGSQIDGYYRYEPFGGKRDELKKAATKIQSTFRGHKARQETQKRMTPEKQQVEEAWHSSGDVLDSFGGKGDTAAARIQAGYRGYNIRKELKARNEAATRIQAGYRGYTVRKSLKEKLGGKPDLQRIDEEDASEENKDLENREEEEAAAIKIQSAFRGHQTRQAVRNEKDGRDSARESKDSTAEDAGAAANEMQREAATKIQSNYRGFHTRKQLNGKQEAATKIQACYRGHRVRKLRRTQSEAAVKIQSYYRGYKTREQLKKRHSTKNFLQVRNDDEFALHRDSRTSFSLPEGVQFEGNLDDDDSDTEIEKMVEQQAKQELKVIEEATSPDLNDNKGDS